MSKPYFRKNVALTSIDTPHRDESITFTLYDDERNAYIVQGEYCIDYVARNELDEVRDTFALVLDNDPSSEDVICVDVCLYGAPTMSAQTLMICCKLVAEHHKLI